MTARMLNLLWPVLLLAGCGQAGDARDAVRITVAPAQVTCTGVTRQRCYQVRFADNEPWQLYYGEIKGFEFKPGNQYVLEVRQQDAKQSDPGQSRLAWELVQEVSRVAVAVSPSAPDAADGPVAKPLPVPPPVAVDDAGETDAPAED